MAHAYTPGLRVSKLTLIQKRRRLPIKGTVHVHKDQKVKAEDIVASALLPGKVHTLNIVNSLGVAPEEIKRYMLKKEGDSVSKGEPIAQTRPILKIFQTTVRSPIDGVVESISTVTGQVLLREPPQKLELKAYIDGTITDVVETEGVSVETTGAFIQGIFGIGGEVIGTLKVIVSGPDEILSPDKLSDEYRDQIIVVGAYVVTEAWQKIKQHGIKGVIVGGIEAYDIKQLLGYELGVAITGMEDIGFTVIITEGFGRMPIARRTFELLCQLDNKKASICGATQIRAGVIRPEIIVPLLDASGTLEQKAEWERGALTVGDMIRVIREPYFGKIGRVKSLPDELQTIDTESKVRVLEVEFLDGQSVIIPRANVEIIET